MSGAWTVRDRSGQLLVGFVCDSQFAVARKVVPVHYDAFRLHVSSSYRALFERALQQVLQREGWRIVRINGRTRDRCVRIGESQGRTCQQEPAWTPAPIGVIPPTRSEPRPLGSP